MLDDVSIVLKKFFHIDPNNLHHITAQVKQRYFTGSHNKKQILHSLINVRNLPSMQLLKVEIASPK